MNDSFEDEDADAVGHTGEQEISSVASCDIVSVSAEVIDLG